LQNIPNAQPTGRIGKGIKTRIKSRDNAVFGGQPQADDGPTTSGTNRTYPSFQPPYCQAWRRFQCGGIV